MSNDYISIILRRDYLEIVLEGLASTKVYEYLLSLNLVTLL